MEIKGIIFDYGGTLDTGGDHWSEVIWCAYGKAGVAVNKAEFREAYVYAERELARTRHILPEHDFGDLLLIKMRLERRLRRKPVKSLASVTIRQEQKWKRQCRCLRN